MHHSNENMRSAAVCKRQTHNGHSFSIKRSILLKAMRSCFAALLVLLCPLWLAAAKQDTAAVQYLGSEMEKPALYNGALPDDIVLPPLEVHLMNVGSADSILLRLGDVAILVDSGIESNANRILTYLASIGVDHLRYAFGTHPHDDHIGGFPHILREIPTDVYLSPALFEDVANPSVQKLDAELRRQQIPVQCVKDGDVLELGGVTLRFLQWNNPSAQVNNRSMVLKVQYGERSILLAADIEEHAQRALADAYGTELRADILKFPHHGLAGYVPAFHEAVLPAFATVSNTQSRIAKTERAFQKYGIQWLLTTQGTVIAITEGTRWLVWQEQK